MKSFKLKNNISVIFDRTTAIEIIAVRVFTPVSVISETVTNAGISNLTARLMVQATKNRSTQLLAEDVENIGTYLVDSVDYDIAGLSMTFLSEYFDRAIEILSDVVLNPAFNEDDISFEKQNIIAAISHRKNSIERTAYDEFIKIFYEKTSYANPVLGLKETVLKIKQEDIIKWHKYSYNASNLLISISGNIEEVKVRVSLEKYFSIIPIGKKFKKSTFNLINSSKIIKKDIKSKFKQAYIYMGFPAPELSDKDFASIKLANVILSGGMSSRFFIELREKLGLAYEVGAYYPSLINKSCFFIYMGLDKKNINLTLKKIDGILKNFCANEVSRYELDDTKKFLKGIYVMDRQTVNKRSYYYGWREIVGQGYKYDEEYLKDVEKVSSQDILRVANRIFSNKFVTVVLMPD
ncbi:MAG: insulinase family protein [Endomicrobium sp.]|jgi:predicted Zn-dependent peptidase|nr:insulinase family protein [Endomicrobium sp.]